MSEPRDDTKMDAGGSKWGPRVDFWIVFGVTFLVVMALAYFLLGAWRESSIATWGALAVAAIAGVAAARTSKVRSGIIDVLIVLQVIS